MEALATVFVGLMLGYALWELNSTLESIRDELKKRAPRTSGDETAEGDKGG